MTKGELYAGTRARVTALVKELSEDELALPVPGCPAWHVRDVVAHVAANTAYATTGDIEGVATDPWTARQVEERKGRSLDELLGEWEQFGPTFENMLDSAGILGDMAVIDLATHEQDIRGAVGRPGATDTPAFDFGLQRYVWTFDQRVRANGLPAVKLVAGDHEWTMGEGEPAVTVETTPLDLFRALCGRRSEAQVRSYAKEGDVTPYLPIVSNFGPLSATDVTD